MSTGDAQPMKFYLFALLLWSGIAHYFLIIRCRAFPPT